MTLFNSVEYDYPVLYYVLSFFGLHLYRVQNDGNHKLMYFNLLMFITFISCIASYFGYLVNLLVSNWSYDVFLGNFKDVLNMIYLLSVYILVFYKRKHACKLLKNLTVFGVPNMKRWLKVTVMVLGVIHSGYSMYLCIRVDNPIGKCCMYVTFTYTIPFIVDIQILMHLGSLVHAYRMVKNILEENNPDLLADSIGDADTNYSHFPLKIKREIDNVDSKLKPCVHLYKEACWYLLNLNVLLNKVCILTHFSSFKHLYIHLKAST